jgi:BirA family biotin operon repressor/biotin-[acetyl-CoA-carboxylase] ligase
VSSFDFHILRFASLASTNTVAAEQARRGASEGVVVVADEQTSGRGRHGRVWASPAGAGLYASIVLRPRFAASDYPLLTFAAALAVKDAVRQVAQLETDIKWSNDVLARERKLCGILAEAIETPAGAAVIIGIGINLRRESHAMLPSEVGLRATSIEAETGVAPHRESLLRALLDRLRSRYDALHLANGKAELLRDYSLNSSFVTGKHVRVEAGGQIFEGTTRGLAADGALRVELSDGEIKIIHAGDINVVRAAAT